MHPGCRSAHSGGFTFAELALGLLVLVIVATFMVNHLTINLHATANERDRVFAYGKAQAILAEIQSHVDRGDLGRQDDLDALDDGVVSKPALTITTTAAGELVPPDHVLSGNFQRDGNWVWSRRITVQPFPGIDNRNVRYVTVRIFQRDLLGEERQVAEVSGVVNSPGAAFPTTQVFDLYLLAIENIPGWWVFMDSIRPFVESTITDLETRNPGLEVRTHWITKASFGRNPAYRPWVNEAVDSLAPIPQVYHYPGRMPDGNASTYYYVPANIKGRIARDGVESGGYDPDANPFPYALCDYFDNAMRYPDELALWQARVHAVEQREAQIAAARAAGTPPPQPLDDMSKEPTLRLFLEDLNTHPEKYRNALVVNLHGELLPMPALRNYSDAAKDPVALPEVRVVTHPEQLRTLRDPANTATEDAKFRVYAYNTNTAAYRGAPVMPCPIAVEVAGVDLTDHATAAPDVRADVRLQDLRGGVMVGTTADYFAFANAKVAGDPSLLPNEMYYSATFVAPANGAPGFTRILLFNTPVVAPPEAEDGTGIVRGLANDERSQLYGMAYVPCPCETARDFTRDLYAPVGAGGGSAPKNTARWRFQVPASAFAQRLFVDQGGNNYRPDDDVVLTVRTRIWTGPGAETSGTMWPPAARNAPDNLSTTYTWWADSRDDVPVTERSQFLGDPRHCPYRDVQHGDPDYPDGYNWYFDSLNNGGKNAQPLYPGLLPANLANRWRGYVNFDAPRLLELLRKGLVASRCVYNSMTGFSYYYLGLGGEIGYDAANGYPNSIPVDLTPYGNPGSSGFVDTITSSRMFVRKSGGGSAYWWGRPWLGELCPDSDYATQWLALDGNQNVRGNLDAGSGANKFLQAPINTVYTNSTQKAYGTAMLPALQRLKEEGCTSLFNIGTSGSTFHHQYAPGDGRLTSIGREIATNYNFNMPETAPISRPFGVATNTSGTVGTEWNQAPYSAERYRGTLLRAYYDHPSGNTGSGLVQLVDPGDTAAAFVVVNGIDRTVESGSNFIAKYSVLSLVHSFFEAGNASVGHRIEQPPRVEILAPTDITELVDPSEIEIDVGVTWTRWDGYPYTETGTFGENEAALEYAVMYSNDGGATWRHVRDGSPATPGERPADARNLLPDAGPGQETYTWSVPANLFPQGSYYLRVDCFRRGAPIHYSYHKTKLFVQR